MDPNATWSELLQSLIEDDWPAAREAAETLVDWLRRGGFPPQVASQLPPEHPWHGAFTQAVCEHILQAHGGDPDATG